MNKLAVLITSVLLVMLIVFTFINVGSFVTDTKKKDINENIREVYYLDEKGKTVTHPINGYAIKKQILDEEHNLIKEYYYDEDGEPVAKSGGYYGIHLTYEQGRCVDYCYVGLDDKPINSTFGYSKVKQVFNERGQVEEVYYLDVNDQPVTLTMGHSGELREFNSDGSIYKVIYTDAIGNPIESRDGYSAIIKNYTEDGYLSTDWYCDLDGQLVDIGHHQYGTHYIYKNGEWIASVPVDANGRQLFSLGRYLSIYPWLIGVIAISLIVLLFFLEIKLRVILSIVYVIFILYLTLFMRETGEINHNFNLLWSYRQLFNNRDIVIQVLGNIWMFIPLGAMFASLKKKTCVILLAIGMSVLIEGTQLVFGLGLCEFDDIISNSLGAWLGFGCYCEGLRLKSRIT